VEITKKRQRLEAGANGEGETPLNLSCVMLAGLSVGKTFACHKSIRACTDCPTLFSLAVWSRWHESHYGHRTCVEFSGFGSTDSDGE
jgi:hypothetical protein